jgi:hypothetical protein
VEEGSEGGLLDAPSLFNPGWGQREIHKNKVQDHTSVRVSYQEGDVLLLYHIVVNSAVLFFHNKIIIALSMQI